jgi:hypothetical protein
MTAQPRPEGVGQFFGRQADLLLSGATTIIEDRRTI